MVSPGAVPLAPYKWRHWGRINLSRQSVHSFDGVSTFFDRKTDDLFSRRYLIHFSHTSMTNFSMTVSRLTGDEV